MLARVAVGSIVVATISASAVARAEEPERAVQLTAQARAAARSGQCAIVELLEPQVRAIDSAYHAASFAADPAIAKCRPPPPEPTYSIETRRDGVAIGVHLSGGSAVQEDVRLGWVADRDIVVFASATFGQKRDFAPLSYRVLALGMRWWVHDMFYLDGRIGRGHRAGACTPPCTTDGVGSLVGVGLEIARWKHASLELAVDYAHVPDLGSVTGGVGVTIY